jgi:prepilin-type N-terminal cleavage/methylation domain-containing protein
MIQKMQKFMSKTNKKGFTLIELIVVIAIIAILAAIALPRLGGFQDNARRSADEAWAKTIAQAVDMYNAANNAQISGQTVSTISQITDMVKTTGSFESDDYAGAPYMYYDAQGNAVIRVGSDTGTIVWAPK